MNKSELERLSRKQGVPMQTLEKDYALTCLLGAVARFPKIGSVVFKGGTSIKKAYYADFRFSEDLDFTCLEDVSADFYDFLKNNTEGFGVRFTETVPDTRTDKSFKFKIKYVQSNGRIDSLRLDMSLRKDVLSKFSSRPILNSYDVPLQESAVPTMSLEEILAEKIRAVLYSKHSRHLYDLYFLHSRGVKLNPDWVRSKIKSAYGGEFSMGKFKERVLEKEKTWMRDLDRFVADVPPFETASQTALKVARDALGTA